MRKKENLQFSLTPITKLPDTVMKQITRRRVNRGLYLTDGEYWDICHNMMREGKLIRYRIKGVCDVEAPRRVSEEHPERDFLAPPQKIQVVF